MASLGMNTLACRSSSGMSLSIGLLPLVFCTTSPRLTLRSNTKPEMGACTVMRERSTSA